MRSGGICSHLTRPLAVTYLVYGATSRAIKINGHKQRIESRQPVTTTKGSVCLPHHKSLRLRQE